MKHTTFAIVHPSALVAAGLTSLVRSIPGFHINVVRLDDYDTLADEIEEIHPSIVMLDVMTASPRCLAELRRIPSGPKIMGVYHAVMPQSMTAGFDAMLSIYDTPERLTSVIRGLLTAFDDADEERRELSPREKDVVIALVKGMSNKEIAAEMHLSVNTIMTHRRNIASKLQIHSPAGLTIYAIMQKLIDINDLQK